MITPQLTQTWDMTGFNAGIVGLSRAVEREPPIVLRKEAGELIKTLVRQSPVAKPKNIRDDIQRKFDIVSNEGLSDMKGRQVGPSGIAWYLWTEKFLFGVAPEMDMRKSSVSDLKRVLYTLSERGPRKMGFKHPRQQQRVRLSQTIVTKRSTLRQLISGKVKNRGRLAAAWLKSVADGVLSLSGSGMPPGFIMDHARKPGVRGHYQDGTSTPGHPTFTITNMAAGVGHSDVVRMVQVSLDIRAKAMQTNAALFFGGKKNLSQYRA